MAERDDIGKMDREIISLISRRTELYIKELRGRGEGDDFAAGDRSRLFELIESCNEGPLSGDALRRMYTELLSASMSAVAPVHVAFLGPAGTQSDIAARGLFGESFTAMPQRTIQDVFLQVEAGAARFGVVPIENSTEGAVTFTMDELLDTSLVILAERYERITYSLLSRSPEISSIKRIYTHPQPLGQCKTWVKTNLPGAEIVSVDSTSRAAEVAAQEEGAAAIASGLAGELYTLNTLASMIEDSRQNYTRFFLIGKKGGAPTGKDKTSIVCAVKDRPGALLNLLRPFSEAGINMTRIESRPDKKKMWEYNFFIDIIGHSGDDAVRKVLEKVKDETIFLKILGSYPIGS